MTEQKKSEKKGGSDISRDIWLAGLGALSAVEKEGSRVFRSLVEQGAKFEEEQRDHIEEVKEKTGEKLKDVESRLEEAVKKAEKAFEKNVNTMISAMGIPGNREIQDLANRVDALSSKIDAIMEKKDSPQGSRTSKKKKA